MGPRRSAVAGVRTATHARPIHPALTCFESNDTRRTPTELRDAAKRILWHWKLLVACTALGFLVPFAFLRGGEARYVASTRLLVSTTADAAASASLADTATAIATSPSQLSWALLHLGVEGDLDALLDEVAVQTIGDSGVVQLSVTDQDPVFAASLANALRAQVAAVLATAQPPEVAPPRLLDPARASTAEEVPRDRSQGLVLGATLGLLLGIGVATVVEALNPTLVGRDAIAAQLGAPVLGELLLAPKDGDPTDLHWVRWRLGAQAARAGVANVELAPADPHVDLQPMSAALVTNGSSPPPRRAANGGGLGSGLKIGILDASSIFPKGSAGLVVVTPRNVKRAAFDATKDLLRITGWPAVGAIVYRGGQRQAPAAWRRLRTRSSVLEDDGGGQLSGGLSALPEGAGSTRGRADRPRT